jgi:hypothetical protein
MYTNDKIFGTKSKADRVNINIISTFESKPECGPGWQVYSGIHIYIKFPDTSALEYELLRYPTKPVGNRYYTTQIPASTKTK